MVASMYGMAAPAACAATTERVIQYWNNTRAGKGAVEQQYTRLCDALAQEALGGGGASPAALRGAAAKPLLATIRPTMDPKLRIQTPNPSRRAL